MFNFQTMNNMINLVSQFQSNPKQMLAKKYNIPSELTDPNQIIKHLVDSNQVTQEQVDGVKQNPMINQIAKMLRF